MPRINLYSVGEALIVRFIGRAARPCLKRARKLAAARRAKRGSLPGSISMRPWSYILSDRFGMAVNPEKPNFWPRVIATARN